MAKNQQIVGIRFLSPLVLFLAVLLCVDGKRFSHNNGHKIRRGRWEGKLKMKFYHKTCHEAKDTVREIVWNKVKANPSLAPKLLRVHYHDCFVRGCDASLLLDSVAGKAASENSKEDEIKSLLEKRCPKTVSCADILNLAARDAVSFQFGRPLWNVFTGRVDGKVSLATEAARDLSSAGAHTIGTARCGVFGRRLLNFTGKGDTDPSLNPSYASFLKSKCSGSFLAQFGRSMIKMSSIKVLTLGDEGGEIRRNCRAVN